MSDNPLETSPEREQQVEARARALWEADGSPEGSMDDYRERADELVRMSMAGNPGQLPIETKDVVEEASIQENYGEFPGRQVDQGDRMEAPMTRPDMRDAMEEDADPTEPAAGTTGARVNPKAS